MRLRSVHLMTRASALSSCRLSLRVLVRAINESLTKLEGRQIETLTKL